IEVFNGEQLAGTGTKQNGIVAVGVWPVGATIDVTPPTSQEHHETLAFTLETAAPVAWTLNDGSTLTGDRVRITPEQHEEGDAALQALELVAANIPSITVTKTVVVRDCNGNGVPDAEDIANGTSLDLNGNGAPDECEALTTTSLSTGFDQQSGGLTAAGADDDDWRVVEPGSARAAKVVNNPPAAWRTLAQSRWIAPDANRGASLPGVTTIAYERCFCLAEEADAVTLDLRLRADNEIAEVTLNGQSLNGSGGAFNDLEPLALTRSGRVGDGLFVAGANCLRVTVTDHGIFTGLNVAGSVSATGGACAPNVTP
ncbi:MAG TPA: hypothetical protein VFN10_04130, partial [Thermoanaerobaculia bacterium]|nr:hypothetical protein [Thermoanaerobaculia bacterium]